MAKIKIEVDRVDALIDIDNGNTVCRICLQNGDDETEMLSIFESDGDEMKLYKKIENCGGIKIINDPDLPTRICKKCNAFLCLAHKFRVICRNSDDYLREFVCKSSQIYGEEDDKNEEGYLSNYEYLTEYNPALMVEGAVGENGGNLIIVSADNGGAASANVAQVLQQAGHEIDVSQTTFNYEEIDEYAEMWLNEEDDIIEEDHGDSSQEQQSFVTASMVGQSTIPSKKTLGISSDGAAVIRVKSEHQLTREKVAVDKQLHICEICGNSYPRKHALEAHMRRHRNERPFECELCGEAFHLNFQLTRHIRKHTGQRPYSCQYCKRSFADRSTLVKHERIHRNERPYECETCGKNFTYSSVLKVHQLTHTGEKPFTCGICSKRFARAHHLRAHLETLLHSLDPRSKVLLKQIKREEDCSYPNENLML